MTLPKLLGIIKEVGSTTRTYQPQTNILQSLQQTQELNHHSKCQKPKLYILFYLEPEPYAWEGLHAIIGLQLHP